MVRRAKHHRLDDVVAEYFATYSAGWREKTHRQYRGAIGRFIEWLEAEKRPLTTESLCFLTLHAFVEALKAQPRASGVWRGDAEAVRYVRTRRHQPTLSLNTVNSYMRAIRTFVLWAADERLIGENPYRRSNRRGTAHPLLPTEETPTKSATVEDLRVLERGCGGRSALDLRDQAIVSLLKTTAVRNSSVRLLRLDDVDLQRDVLTFRRAKGGKTFEMALHPESKVALLRYLNRGRRHFLRGYPVRGFEDVLIGSDPGWVFLGRRTGAGDDPGPLTTGGLSAMLTRRYHAGGGALRYFGSHRVRHGVATQLVNNGMALDEVSAYLAHSSIVPTKRYAQQTAASLGERAARALQQSGVTDCQRRQRAR